MGKSIFMESLGYVGCASRSCMAGSPVRPRYHSLDKFRTLGLSVWRACLHNAYDPRKKHVPLDFICVGELVRSYRLLRKRVGSRPHVESHSFSWLSSRLQAG